MSTQNIFYHFESEKATVLQIFLIILKKLFSNGKKYDMIYDRYNVERFIWS